MPEYTVLKCDACRTEAHRDTAIGWRELNYIGGLRREEDDTERKVFCSLECVEWWAEGNKAATS